MSFIISDIGNNQVKITDDKTDFYFIASCNATHLNPLYIKFIFNNAGEYINTWYREDLLKTYQRCRYSYRIYLIGFRYPNVLKTIVTINDKAVYFDNVPKQTCSVFSFQYNILLGQDNDTHFQNLLQVNIEKFNKHVLDIETSKLYRQLQDLKKAINYMRDPFNESDYNLEEYEESDIAEMNVQNTYQDIQNKLDKMLQLQKFYRLNDENRCIFCREYKHLSMLKDGRFICDNCKKDYIDRHYKH